MGDLFKALGSGIARFVYAWLMPSVVAAGVFVAVVVPNLEGRTVRVSVTGAATFTLGVLSLSVIFAYSSRPLYQFLEGYTMPSWMARPMRRRSQQRFLRLQWEEMHGVPLRRQLATEALKAFPDRLDLVLPTRLGNALKAMEGYGNSRYGLDSQTFWYELLAVADDKIRLSTEETRAAVDFFMSSIAHLTLLLAVCLAIAPAAEQPWPIVGVGLAAALLAPLAYRQAVRNVAEWRWSVQALVNTSRPALARALALTMPPTYDTEMEMWEGAAGLVHYGRLDDYLAVLDARRAFENPPDRPDESPDQITFNSVDKSPSPASGPDS